MRSGSYIGAAIVIVLAIIGFKIAADLVADSGLANKNR